MIVTQLTPVSKDRVKVYIDMEFAFVLYKGELRLYKIKEETEISEKTYHEILKEVLPKRAKLRSMNLLKARNYTQKELIKKLYDGGYQDKIIEEAIDYVKSFGYIDDAAYAQSYVRSYVEQKSRKKIEYELKQKGVDKGLIDAAFSLWEEENKQNSKEKEEELIRKLLKKKGFRGEEATAEEKRKIVAFLYRKGFSYDEICKIISVQDV